jgi:hypothetical protein
LIATFGGITAAGFEAGGGVCTALDSQAEHVGWTLVQPVLIVAMFVSRAARDSSVRLDKTDLELKSRGRFN